MKNPYKREDHRQAFDEAVELIKNGMDYLTAAKRLNLNIPREMRKQIAAKAARLLKLSA